MQLQMHFKQFMFGYCCEMLPKHRLLLLILILIPLIDGAENIRKRRRPGLDQQLTDLNGQYPDQIALAARFQPSHLISAAYSENQEPAPSNYRHGNLVVNLIRTSEPDRDLYDRTLSESKTAEEYVTQALRLQSPNGNKLIIQPYVPKNDVPSTSFSKYEVYEDEEIQEDEPEAGTNQNKDSMTGSRYDKYEYTENRDDYQKPQQSFNSYTTEQYNQHFDISPYESAAENSVRNADDKERVSSTKVAKSEIFRHIEESVMRYMKALEAEGKIPPPTQAPRKPYYQPEHNSAYRTTRSKVNSQAENTVRPVTPKPPPLRSHYNNNGYNPTNPLQDIMEDFNHNVEFIYKIKTRPAAQQQHSGKRVPNFDHLAALKSAQEFDAPTEESTKRPKLYFNSDTYHDINSLPYKAEKDNAPRPNEYLRPEHRGYASPNSEQDTFYGSGFVAPEEQRGKGATNDGFPIMNPYQYVLKNPPSLPSQSDSNDYSAEWNPHIPGNKPSNPKPSYNSNPLAYNSYSPKYNNNPEGYGYQHNYKHQDMHGSFTSNRPSKVTTSGCGKRAKSKGSNCSGRKAKESLSSMKPPPPY